MLRTLVDVLGYHLVCLVSPACLDRWWDLAFRYLPYLISQSDPYIDHSKINLLEHHSFQDSERGNLDCSSRIALTLHLPFVTNRPRTLFHLFPPLECLGNQPHFCFLSLGLVWQPL